MPTLDEMAAGATDLDSGQIEHIHRLLAWWQLIADMSFADLTLWCPLTAADGFMCVAQMRPYTAQTLHPEDVVGEVLRPEENPVIDRALREGRSWMRDEPLLIDGIPVRMEAVPVFAGGEAAAVMVKEGAPLTRRRPGVLEENYLACASALTTMVQEGTLPFQGEHLDPELLPRVGDGLVRLDSNGKILYASPNAVSAYRRLGVVSGHDVHLGDLPIDAGPVLLALETALPVMHDIESGSAVVALSAVPFIGGGVITGGMVLLRDVSELRHRERLLERKEAIIREIHHRVKNNLQTIASLLRIQARRLTSEEARSELEEATQRIASIALVHETLSQDSSEAVDFAAVARGIVEMMQGSLVHPEAGISVEFHGESGMIPAEMATPLALTVVELVQNAVEHAFGPSGGRVAVGVERREGRLRLEVSDDGRGLPDGFSPQHAGLGLQIVGTLVEEELGGVLELRRGSPRGTNVLVEVRTKGAP